VWDAVIEDMKARDKIGEARYGTRLQPFNGRDAITYAYQEALDLVVYLKQAKMEMDGNIGEPLYKKIAKPSLEIFCEETGVDVWDPKFAKLHVRLQNAIYRIIEDNSKA
jgi:hypothetical protein